MKAPAIAPREMYQRAVPLTGGSGCSIRSPRIMAVATYQYMRIFASTYTAPAKWAHTSAAHDAITDGRRGTNMAARPAIARIYVSVISTGVVIFAKLTKNLSFAYAICSLFEIISKTLIIVQLQLRPLTSAGSQSVVISAFHPVFSPLRAMR